MEKKSKRAARPQRQQVNMDLVMRTKKNEENLKSFKLKLLEFFKTRT